MRSMTPAITHFTNDRFLALTLVAAVSKGASLSNSGKEVVGKVSLDPRAEASLVESIDARIGSFPFMKGALIASGSASDEGEGERAAMAKGGEGGQG